uniref:Amino acid transporter transmembrane domain-containing protein n=1 Tax=Ditylenchus dipsaci TaxID=166011 RepID=A0A915DP05_9BILA
MAMFTTSLAVILIILGAGMDYEYCKVENQAAPASFANFFLALGTFIFVYGGHASFPTIQHDMRRPHEFTKSSVLAFITVALMYTPVSLMGYFAYGDSLRDSIINSLQSVWIQQTVNILITLHCLLTLCIIFSPLNQEAEELFDIPHHFCAKRVLIRGGMMAGALFFAETVPNFGALMDLIGGSTIALTSLVFPSIFIYT